ncbi:DHS-like NAD/FAD-binding domain-containing protein [Rickenella mellea]|uniref:DHS-like NAD/FAD-binding domain-containing protein n=1 Tax=Rickenella mellea TaxID=50990 RepID=A0A4Y7QLW1_9AGAM|nr:DHS-like NAD/FAD-binding domain-containing protein [Rickenella mellea]
MAYLLSRVRGKSPNEAHRILARLCTPSLRQNVAPNAERVTHVTQNVDGLSLEALSAVSGLSSSESIIEMHGNLFNVACTAHDCSYTSKNTDNPICPALGGTEKIVAEGNTEPIVKRAFLPHCPEKGCGQLLRPDVVWFGERPKHIEMIIELAKVADLCLVVGTSSLVQPASRLPAYVRANGGKVAVFNMEQTNHSDEADWVFLGGCEVELGRVLGL